MVVLAAAAALSCSGEAPKEAPKPTATATPVPKPSPAPAAAPAGDGGVPDARPKMVSNPDGLTLAERIAKKKIAEDKLAAELAAAEKERLLKYDKTKLPQHVSLFAFWEKTRKQYDDLFDKVKGKPDAKDKIGKLADSLQKTLVANGKTVQTIDPKGGNSNIVTDHDVILNALNKDYPDALVAALAGDEAPLKEQRAELDRRFTKIRDWLAELKAAGKKK